MKRSIILLIFISLVFSCKQSNKIGIDEELSDWEFKMVSRGSNRPSFDAHKDSIQFLPILLHKGYDTKEIMQYFGWSGEDFHMKKQTLLMNGFLKMEDNQLIPMVMVISEKEAEDIRKDVQPVAKEIVKAIVQHKDVISNKIDSVSCFEGFSANELSLLVYSNILLDNGQLGNIEKDYLKANRPERNQNRYYASYQEKRNPSFEALGIYGNHVQPDNGFMLCRYGNQRYSDEVLKINVRILEDYRNLKAKETFNYPVITSQCQGEIQDIADYFKPFMIEILEKNDLLLRTAYRNSTYSNEVGYNEYFMWVYHILYTLVTDKLIASGEITIPQEKVSFYVFQP